MYFCFVQVTGMQADEKWYLECYHYNVKYKMTSGTF